MKRAAKRKVTLAQLGWYLWAIAWDFKLHDKLEESRFIFATWFVHVIRYILLTNYCCNNQQQRSSESYHVWIFLAAFWNLRGREEAPLSIRATNKWTSVSVRVERVGHCSATHVRRYRFVCALHVCLWKKLVCVCAHISCQLTSHTNLSWWLPWFWLPPPSQWY